jgi:hypothetical protein
MKLKVAYFSSERHQQEILGGTATTGPGTIIVGRRRDWADYGDPNKVQQEKLP